MGVSVFPSNTICACIISFVRSSCFFFGRIKLTELPAAKTGVSVPPSGISFIQLATVLAGLHPLSERGINESYRGQLLIEEGIIRPAIIKDLDERQLANELMVAALADAAGMPIPQAHLAMVPPEISDLRKGPLLSNGSRLAFGSTDVATPAVAQLYRGLTPAASRAVHERLSNWDGVGNLYGFDSWVANIDRHDGNLLFGGDGEVWLIDHGHCFTGPEWKASDLEPPRTYSNLLKLWLTPVMTEKRRMELAVAAESICTIVDALDLHEIAELNYVATILDEGDLNALVEFLSARNPHVPRLSADALNLIV